MRYRMATKILIVTLLLTACVTAPKSPEQTQGDNYTYTRNHMRWMIKEKMTNHDIVGLSIALVDDQRVVWAQGFGFSNESDNAQATPETIYRVGSITKLFTATAAMQLSERGKLDIDQPIQDYLPQFQIKSRFPAAGPITARNIMTHHSGLPTDYLNGMWGDNTADFTHVASALRDEYTAAAPNVIGAYSNLGFTLLGHAIEEVSGVPFENYVKTEILDPIGMKQSSISGNLGSGAPNAAGYFDEKEYPTPVLRDLPAGGLNSSVLDMARFAQMTFKDGQVSGGTILHQETVRQMLSPQYIDSPFELSHRNGLGWHLDESFEKEAGLIASHNGGTPMFISEFATLPKYKLAVVVLSNSNSAQGITAEIARQTLKLALESKTGIRLEEPAGAGKEIPTEPADLACFPGMWSSQLGLIEIKRKGGKLKLEVEGTTLNLVHRESGAYHIQYKWLGLLPVSLGGIEKAGLRCQRIAGRELLVLYTEGKPRSVFAEKVVSQALPVGWQHYLGEYEMVNPKGALSFQRVKLRYTNDLLQAHIKAKFTPGETESYSVVLLPVSETQAIVHGLGRSKGDTIQFTIQDGQYRMSYSGFLLRKVE